MTQTLQIRFKILYVAISASRWSRRVIRYRRCDFWRSTKNPDKLTSFSWKWASGNKGVASLGVFSWLSTFVLGRSFHNTSLSPRTSCNMISHHKNIGLLFEIIWAARSMSCRGQVGFDSVLFFFLFMVRLSDRKVLLCWTKVIERTKTVFLSSFNSSWTTDTNIIQTYLALYYLDIIYIILYKISKLYTLCYLVILSRKTTLCNSLSAYNNLKPHI
jgi:hypothetical protein